MRYTVFTVNCSVKIQHPSRRFIKSIRLKARTLCMYIFFGIGKQHLNCTISVLYSFTSLLFYPGSACWRLLISVSHRAFMSVFFAPPICYSFEFNLNKISTEEKKEKTIITKIKNWRKKTAPLPSMCFSIANCTKNEKELHYKFNNNNIFNG